MIEFDRAEYPELLSCYVMPALEPGFTEVEITDWDNNKVVVPVPEAAVRRLNMPRLGGEAAKEPMIVEVISKGIGLGLLACSIVNRNEELVSVSVPGVEAPHTVVVPLTRLAKRM